MQDGHIIAIKNGLSEMGPVFNHSVLARTRNLLAPHIPERLKQAPSIRCKYGADPRHELDLYLPAGAVTTTVLFVPGGGFIGGEKDDGGMLYRNIGNFFAEKGNICAVMNYRLAPAHRWPAGGEDVALAISWLGDNIREHGGDATRIHLVAQSAGAFHAATVLFHPQLRKQNSVLSATLLSGPYLPEMEPFAENYRAYFGTDREAVARCNVITHVGRTAIPIFLAAAEYDPPKLILPSFALAQALTKANERSPRFHWFAGHNHVSPVQAVGTPLDVLGPSLVDFFGYVEGKWDAPRS